MGEGNGMEGGTMIADDLLAFYKDVAPFLRRLRKPRFDDNETNDYVCGSTDCAAAIAALDRIESYAELVKFPKVTP